MPEIPQFFKNGLKDIAGCNIYGEPMLRVVWSPDERKLKGVGAGTWKYPDVDDPSQPMKCWVLESWAPPQFFGDPAAWDHEKHGESFPTRGRYVMRTPLVIINEQGKTESLKLDEECLNSIRGMRAKDIDWFAKTVGDRQKDIEASIRHNDKLRTDAAQRESEDAFDHFTQHEQDLNNSVTRVWSMPKHLESTATGNKMPVKY